MLKLSRSEVIKMYLSPRVRYTRFEQDRVVASCHLMALLSLMRYRVNTKTNVTVPIYVTPVVTMSDQHNAGYGRIQMGRLSKADFVPRDSQSQSPDAN